MTRFIINLEASRLDEKYPDIVAGLDFTSTVAIAILATPVREDGVTMITVFTRELGDRGDVEATQELRGIQAIKSQRNLKINSFAISDERRSRNGSKKRRKKRQGK